MKMINRIAIVSLILLCLFVTPVTVSASESRTLYDDGNYTGALHLLNQALRSNPTSVDLLTDMGATLNEMGNYTGVISFFKKVLSIDPHHIGALAGIVSTLDSIGKHSGAHIFQRRSLNQQEMLSHRMRKLLHSRIWEIILKPWRSSTQPANLAALGIKGVVFLYQKNTTGAMVIFNRILAAHQTPWALDNKCIALSELGNLTEALRLFDRAITLNPHDVSAYYNGGIVPDRMKNLTGALTMYDKALKLTPRDSDLIYNLAIYALRLGLGDIHISSALGGCS